jgi:hypothetical protein
VAVQCDFGWHLEAKGIASSDTLGESWSWNNSRLEEVLPSRRESAREGKKMISSRSLRIQHLNGITYLIIRAKQGMTLRYALQTSFVVSSSRPGKAALASNQVTLAVASR